MQMVTALSRIGTFSIGTSVVNRIDLINKHVDEEIFVGTKSAMFTIILGSTSS